MILSRTRFLGALGALGMTLLAAPSLAQGPMSAQDAKTPAPAPTAGSRPSMIVPSQPATWDAIDQRTVVDTELGSAGGWYFWPPILQWRFLDSSQWATTDPIVEIMIYAPYSGSPTNNESFFLQVPLTTPVPATERGVIIGFHGYNVSPGQIFGIGSGNHDLPQFCTNNGWLLVAPTGVVSTNMGSVLSQRALEVSLALVVGVFDFNFDKVYSLGFSMGGLGAASFAMRHQDPFALRPAGLIYHTGTVDLVREYQQQPAGTKALWADDLHFGASYAVDPFAYDRVNTALFNATGDEFLDDDFAFDSLKHVPFYLHSNTNDPSYLVNWNDELFQELTDRGFTFKKVVSAGPVGHTIFSLDFDDALNYITQFEAGPLPTSAELYADRPARYLWSEMLSDPQPNIARYTTTIDAPTNDFTVEDTHHVDQLGYNLSLMGLDPSQTLTFTASSGDGTQDTYVLQGYPTVPSTILVNDAPPFSWSYDGVTGELTITPTSDGSLAVVQVVP